MKTYLTRHMNIHTSRYKCSKCGKCYRDTGGLAVHRRIHSGDKPFGCSVCGKRFTRATSLTVHSRIHSGEKPYKCRLCDKAFALCSECFGTVRQLKIHQLMSHNEGTWFTCHICLKKFSTKCHLKEHMQRHEGVKSYVCDECPKRFYRAFELKQHQLVHSDYRQFGCFLCSATFKSKQGAKKHIMKCSAVDVTSTCVL